MNPDRSTDNYLANRETAKMALLPFVKAFEDWQKRSAWLRGAAERGDRSSKLRDGLRALRVEIVRERRRFGEATAAVPTSYTTIDVTRSFERMLQQLDDALAPWTSERLSQDRP
jgi:hypothetical protein